MHVNGAIFCTKLYSALYSLFYLVCIGLFVLLLYISFKTDWHGHFRSFKYLIGDAIAPDLSASLGNCDIINITVNKSRLKTNFHLIREIWVKTKIINLCFVLRHPTLGIIRSELSGVPHSPDITVFNETIMTIRASL